MRPPRLSRRYAVGFIAAAILPMALIGLVIGLSLSAYLDQELRGSARSLIESVAMETGRYFQNARDHLLVYASLLDGGTALGELAGVIGTTQRAHAEIRRIFVLAPGGRVVLAAPADEGLEGRDMSGIRLAGLELGGPEADGGFSRAFLSPIDGSVTVYAGAGLKNGGAVVMELDLGSVSAFLGPLRIEPRDEIGLVDERGRFIAHSDPENVRLQRNETAFGPGGYGERSLDDGRGRWLVRAAPIAGTPWRAIYYKETSKRRDIISSVLGIAGFVALSCVVGAAALGLGNSTALRRAVAAFSAGVRSVADGDYEAAIPPPYAELSELSESVAKMASSVAAREAKLREAVAEREQVLKEIHHRVKNNLQIIVSLLNLELGQHADGPSAAPLEDSIRRVYAMSLVHQLLYANERLDRVDVADYAGRLVSYLGGALGGPLDAAVLAAPEGMVIPPDAAVPFGLALSELVSNAYKHGASADGSHRLTVTIAADGGELVLEVRDGGHGFDEAPAGGGAERGLGLTLIRALASQLGGSVAWGRAPDGAGTAAILRFPKPA